MALFFLEPFERMGEHYLQVGFEKCDLTGHFLLFMFQSMGLFDEIAEALSAHNLLHKLIVTACKLFQVRFKIKHVIATQHLLLCLVALLEITEVVVYRHQKKIEETLLHSQLNVGPIVLVYFITAKFRLVYLSLMNQFLCISFPHV